MSIIENILKRFGYKKEVPESIVSMNIDLEDVELDGIWSLEGVGGLSSTRRPVDPRGKPVKDEGDG